MLSIPKSAFMLAATTLVASLSACNLPVREMEISSEQGGALLKEITVKCVVQENIPREQWKPAALRQGPIDRYVCEDNDGYPVFRVDVFEGVNRIKGTNFVIEASNAGKASGFFKSWPQGNGNTKIRQVEFTM